MQYFLSHSWIMQDLDFKLILIENTNQRNCVTLINILMSFVCFVFKPDSYRLDKFWAASSLPAFQVEQAGS